MSLNRRDLLKLGAGAIGMGMTGLMTRPSLAAFKEIPLCLQLYTVHGISDDPAKRFADVAAMGYKGVEYAGFGGKSAKELRKYQDDAGLFCSGSHSGRDQIEDPEKLKRAIEFHQELGAKFIICPGMSNKGVDGWKKAGETFAKASEEARKAGLYVGYHAHQPDFEIIDKENGLSSWEVFANASNADVMLQIDLGHCVNKGADAYKLIAKYPGRSKTVHLKESDGKIIGEGRVDWKKSFELLEGVGGAETYTIEYEAGMDRMEAAKLSAEAYYKIHG